MSVAMFLLSVLTGVVALGFSTNQNEDKHDGRVARPVQGAEPGQQPFVLPPSEPASGQNGRAARPVQGTEPGQQPFVLPPSEPLPELLQLSLRLQGRTFGAPGLTAQP